jgi:hypothetical protein
MIRVLIEVGSDTARFGVAVRASSIQHTVEVVKAYYPGADIQAVHPIDTEAFFVGDPPRR